MKSRNLFALLALLLCGSLAGAHPTVAPIRGGHGHYHRPVVVAPFVAQPYYAQPLATYPIYVAPQPIVTVAPAVAVQSYVAPVQQYVAPVQALETSCHASLVGQPYYALPQQVLGVGYSAPLAVVLRDNAFYHRHNGQAVSAVLAQRLHALNRQQQLRAFLRTR